MKRLWGDQFYNPKDRKWSKTAAKDNVRGFCQFVLDPIFKVREREREGRTEREREGGVRERESGGEGERGQKEVWGGSLGVMKVSHVPRSSCSS